MPFVHSCAVLLQLCVLLWQDVLALHADYCNGSRCSLHVTAAGDDLHKLRFVLVLHSNVIVCIVMQMNRFQLIHDMGC